MSQMIRTWFCSQSVRWCIWYGRYQVSVLMIQKHFTVRYSAPAHINLVKRTILWLFHAFRMIESNWPNQHFVKYIWKQLLCCCLMVLRCLLLMNSGSGWFPKRLHKSCDRVSVGNHFEVKTNVSKSLFLLLSGKHQILIFKLWWICHPHHFASF